MPSLSHSSYRGPDPIWPEIPRLCPHVEFPPYRHVPGITPHPINDPEGHSYGEDHNSGSDIYLPPESWAENEQYLYGIDLYHHSFFWEAHEAWEELWMMAGRDEPEGRFLQALIQNAAAQLKLYLGVIGGVKSLSRHAWEKFRIVHHSGTCDLNGRFMGIHIATLIEQVEQHYRPLWATLYTVEPVPVGRPPVLIPG